MTTRTWASVVGVVVLAGRAMGQAPATKPAEDPALTSPGTEQQLRDLPGRGTPEGLVYPNKAAVQPRGVVGVPAPEGVNFSVPGRRSYPEGTFVSQRRGRVVRAKGGEVVWVPGLPAAGEAGDPPMILARCATLEQLEAALAVTPEAGVVVSGQVFVYRGRHYLLPTTFAVDLVMEKSVEKAAEPAPAERAPGEIAAEDLIRQLETQRGAPKAVEAPAGEGGAERLAGVANEGTLLVNRRARLVRVAADEGRFGAAFDKGAGGDKARMGAMPILPCAALEGLEFLAANRGENVSFYVSGRVFVYNGRNYLLPTLVQATRAGDIAPLH